MTTMTPLLTADAARHLARFAGDLDHLARCAICARNTPAMTTMTEMFGEPIYAYTAEQAEEDGALVRVPAELSKAPIYLTRNLYETWIAVPAGLEGWQDVTGRMADLVNMARLAFSGGDREDGMRTNIVCRFQMTPRTARSVTVWGVIDGVGLTLMLPEDY